MCIFKLCLEKYFNAFIQLLLPDLVLWYSRISHCTVAVGVLLFLCVEITRGWSMSLGPVIHAGMQEGVPDVWFQSGPAPDVMTIWGSHSVDKASLLFFFFLSCSLDLLLSNKLFSLKISVSSFYESILIV